MQSAYANAKPFLWLLRMGAMLLSMTISRGFLILVAVKIFADIFAGECVSALCHNSLVPLTAGTKPSAHKSLVP
jgi:hypothetical protein